MALPLEFTPGPMPWLAAASATALSALLTGLTVRYARHAGLLDMPGQRRSHAVPTPRGGGAGIVVVALLGLWVVWPLEWEGQLALSVAIATVGLVGWIDDHRGLPALARLVVQLLAAMLAVAALIDIDAGFGFALLAVLGVVGSTNVMNFMDGSDGMATLEGIFLALAATLLAAAAGELDWALWCLLIACACLGFLPFNAPRARVFLGDVGSTSLGFCLAVAGVALVVSGAMTLWQALLLGSAFFGDAGCTLAWRILRGRRWYTAHREHTYQWLIRSGFSHPEVAAAYMAWNLLLVSPLIILGMHRPAWQPALAAGAYVLALLAWSGARAWCLRRSRMRTA